jgi:hypothetical protein
VSVEEGQVQVHHLLQPGDDKILNQNEWVRIYPNQRLAKVVNQGPGWKFVFDRIKNAVADIILNNPGGVVGGNGGTLPGAPGGQQGDAGKTKKNPPTTAPPAAPPGGGN